MKDLLNDGATDPEADELDDKQEPDKDATPDPETDGATDPEADELDDDVMTMPAVQGVTISQADWSKFSQRLIVAEKFIATIETLKAELTDENAALREELEAVKAIDPSERLECSPDEFAGYKIMLDSAERTRMSGVHGIAGENLQKQFLARLAKVIVKPVEAVLNEREGLPNWPTPPRRRRGK